MRTHVSAESLTEDPNVGNNHEEHRVSVHENKRPEAVDRRASSPPAGGAERRSAPRHPAQ